MDRNPLRDIFVTGYRHGDCLGYSNALMPRETLLVCLGKEFFESGRKVPRYIYTDPDGVVIISEDLKTYFSVFAIGGKIILIDQLGQFLKISNYPTKFLEQKNVNKPTRLHVTQDTKACDLTIVHSQG